MNHFLSALVSLGGQRSHRSRHFVLCEFHRSISEVSSRRHAPSALTLPGIVLFTLRSGVICQQRAPNLFALQRGPGRPSFLPALLCHGGSHSLGKARLSHAKGDHGRDSARIELRESTGKHVGYWNGAVSVPPRTLARPQGDCGGRKEVEEERG